MNLTLAVIFLFSGSTFLATQSLSHPHNSVIPPPSNSDRTKSHLPAIKGNLFCREVLLSDTLQSPQPGTKDGRLGDPLDPKGQRTGPQIKWKLSEGTVLFLGACVQSEYNSRQYWQSPGGEIVEDWGLSGSNLGFNARKTNINTHFSILKEHFVRCGQFKTIIKGTNMINSVNQTNRFMSKTSMCCVAEMSTLDVKWMPIPI